ncbi:NEO1 [Lepeophtheirus salmonis]|uniref:NEO1 n=1 Tax=Lepeophtheirus salmonis TaxID=72036 RepID=A0A7R8H5M9_LEPSM|nr:NEO1 [Lepeophtheirus salmonis]CAF2880624.1 NEO1 [Lepeophtheirus salmonis]
MIQCNCAQTTILQQNVFKSRECNVKRATLSRSSYSFGLEENCLTPLESSHPNESGDNPHHRWEIFSFPNHKEVEDTVRTMFIPFSLAEKNRTCSFMLHKAHIIKVTHVQSTLGTSHHPRCTIIKQTISSHWPVLGRNQDILHGSIYPVDGHDLSPRPGKEKTILFRR